MITYPILFIIITSIICLTLMMLNIFFSMIKFKNFEKKTPFECGFMPISNSYLPFSLPFYLMILMFLIFDIEIVLLIPIINYLPYSNSMCMYMSTYLLITFMFTTLIYEIINNYLKWIY
uniref:NADH dehydrogenase subunit 3 n=1 Tax=Melecta chinensis TaxID=582934 RepID=UPI0025520716|nr:NADH dehydrogenase subunit 3 [Melecta chinensis]WFP44656.1 NADH dehydrogenase subunit 3 [Melecta chinensis]